MSRVLMMTAAWPPVGRVGARRPLRLARRLEQHGWTPIVLTPDPESEPFYRAPSLDHSLTEPDVEVHRVPALFPGVKARRLLDQVGASKAPKATFIAQRIIDGLQLPDHIVEWSLAARRRARALGPVDVVWATGGPWGLLVAAGVVARALDRPLVLDYRDPWTVAPKVFSKNPLKMPAPVYRWMEGQLLGQARAVSYVYRDNLERNQKVFGQPEGTHWQVIPNGFDPLDLPDGEAIKPERPTLIYAGSCYESRSMKPILEALHAGFPGDPSEGLQLKVFGELDPPAKQFLDAHPLGERVKIMGRIPAHDLAGHLKGADGLLVITGEQHKRAIAAKIFDYLLAGRPMLSYGPPGSDAEDLLHRCGAGRWVNSGDQTALIEALKAVERRDLDFDPKPEEIARHSADAMTAEMASLLRFAAHN
ncbi:MAG: hypothetical protein ACE366_19545 [Bradymonadia bacterium]